jgi:phosphoglucomutase
LADIVRTLPKYFSTALYEQRSLVEIRSGDHDRLKSRYEEILSSRWPEFEPELSRRMGITGYRIVQYEGTRTIHGPGQRSWGGQGGFKVILTGRDGREIGFLWMRDSKTEPVFRVMADISTSREDEKYLLELHRGILVQADNL